MRSAKEHKPQQSRVMQNSNKTIQSKINNEDYKIDEKTRKLFYDSEAGYYTNRQIQNKEKDGIAILYETIATRDKASQSIERFISVKNEYPDSPIGLSIVVNGPYVNQDKVKDTINQLKLNVDNNYGISVEYDVWQYSEESNIRAQIPFYSLRRRAAINPGAETLYNELKNVKTVVWRKMGDDDMTFHSPSDSYNTQMNKLNSKEYKYKSMVTFGYNLADSVNDILDIIHKDGMPYTQSIDYAIRINKILTYLYIKEMELRQKINYRYTIEPTTYYKTDTPNKVLSAFTNTNKQIREGETFEKQLIDKESQHVFDYSIQEKTKSGGRNKNIIELLFTALQNSKIPEFSKCKELIMNLNQSAFNPNTIGVNLYNSHKEMIVNDIEDVYNKIIIVFRDLVYLKLNIENTNHYYSKIGL